MRNTSEKPRLGDIPHAAGQYHSEPSHEKQEKTIKWSQDQRRLGAWTGTGEQKEDIDAKMAKSKSSLASLSSDAPSWS